MKRAWLVLDAGLILGLLAIVFVFAPIWLSWSLWHGLREGKRWREQHGRGR